MRKQKFRSPQYSYWAIIENEISRFICTLNMIQHDDCSANDKANNMIMFIYLFLFLLVEFNWPYIGIITWNAQNDKDDQNIEMAIA